MRMPASWSLRLDCLSLCAVFCADVRELAPVVHVVADLSQRSFSVSSLIRQQLVDSAALIFGACRMTAVVLCHPVLSDFLRSSLLRRA